MYITGNQSAASDACSCYPSGDEHDVYEPFQGWPTLFFVRCLLLRIGSGSVDRIW